MALFSPSLNMRTTGGRHASPFPFLLSLPLSFPGHLRGGITFHQPSSHVPATAVITVHSFYLLFLFMLFLQDHCLFSHMDPILLHFPLLNILLLSQILAFHSSSSFLDSTFSLFVSLCLFPLYGFTYQCNL